VLFVDDEPNVLSGIRRGLRNDFDVHTAESGAEALRLIASSAPFAVIVSDCRMPEMDGVELLQRCSKAAPQSVRIMLTGNMDQETAVRAVNSGDVFKFLNKPCAADQLRQIVAQAVRQYELVTAEKELLEQTLQGSIKVLADLLAISKPEAFGRTGRLRRKVQEVARHLDGIKAWELDAATLLSQLGCINVAQEILDKVQRGEGLSAREEADYAAHPLLGAELIGRIPRLQRVAMIILYQNKGYDGSGFPIDDIKGDDLPLEARVLHAVLLHDQWRSLGWSDAAIVERLKKASGKIDPAVLSALIASAEGGAAIETLRVLPNELMLGMIVQEDVKTDQGVMLICHGHEVTPAIRDHLVKFQKMGAVAKPILVSKPPKAAADAKAVA
jgi:response regulator RpfG family c-di-GMP phosphodiesterase